MHGVISLGVPWRVLEKEQAKEPITSERRSALLVERKANYRSPQHKRHHDKEDDEQDGILPAEIHHVCAPETRLVPHLYVCSEPDWPAAATPDHRGGK
jgi:hypothetical protein